MFLANSMQVLWLFVIIFFVLLTLLFYPSLNFLSSVKIIDCFWSFFFIFMYSSYYVEINIHCMHIIAIQMLLENKKFFELKSEGYRDGIKRKETR